VDGIADEKTKWDGKESIFVVTYCAAIRKYFNDVAEKVILTYGEVSSLKIIKGISIKSI